MNASLPRAPRTWTAAARAACLPGVVVVAALAAYGNTLDVPLVFDDQHLLGRAELHARSLAPAELARAAQGFPLQRWLAFVTFAANHAVHGLRPAGYHAVNLAIHVAVALVFMRVALLLLRRLAPGEDATRRTAAGVAALLFAVHPVQTMAVTYVIQRMTSLGALFALLSVWLWLRARDAGGIRTAPAAGAVVAWWLAISCKENYAVLPALVLLVEWCAGFEPLTSARRHPLVWGALAAVGAVAGAFAIRSYWPVIQNPLAEYAMPLGDRLLTQGRVLWHYLSLLALPLPSRLHVDYAWQPSTGLLSPPTTLLALAGVMGLAGAAVALRRRAPLATLAIGWFLVALAIEQSVFPIDLVFEQRVYFASLGLFVLAGWAVASLRLAGRPAALAAALPLAAVLAVATHARNEVWRDPARLFLDPAAAGPGRARSLVNAGRELERHGDLDGAERALQAALALDPEAALTRAYLGTVALDRGRLEEAVRWYREAIAAGVEDADVPYNLAGVLRRLGRPGEAREAYRLALAMEPALTDARVGLALLADDGGDRAAALALLDEAVALDPQSPFALMNRALFRSEARRDGEALADARAALRLAPGLADTHAVLATVHRRAGRRAEARAEAMQALRMAPDNGDAAAVLRDLGPGPP